MIDTIVLPGRHHLVTRYQLRYLAALARGGTHPCVDGTTIDIAEHPTIIWAVTSADHDNTRRNPLALWERATQIHLATADQPGDHLVVPIRDSRTHHRFAAHTITVIEAALGPGRCHPDRTLIACSTPAVIDMYHQHGYRIAGVELDLVRSNFNDPDDIHYTTRRPWELVEASANGDHETFTTHAAPGSVEHWQRYGLHRRIRDLFADPVTGDDSELTATRDYTTYVRSFDDAAARKWQTIAPHIRPGRIVDIGSAAGALIKAAAADPRLTESDLHGVELALPLHRLAQERQTRGEFGHPNVFLHHRNAITRPLFTPGTVDTILTVALTHEIVSYAGRDELDRLAHAISDQLRPGGRWICLDVVGPRHGTTLVDLWCDPVGNDDDGRPLTGDDADWLATLSTRARLDVFARTFRATEHEPFAMEHVEHDGTPYTRMALRDAMEFVTKMDYIDNWLSEMHERFCTLDGDDWETLASAAGLDIVEPSGVWRNDWIVTNRFDGRVTLHTTDGLPLAWPETHITLIAEKP